MIIDNFLISASVYSFKGEPLRTFYKMDYECPLKLEREIKEFCKSNARAHNLIYVYSDNFICPVDVADAFD